LLSETEPFSEYRGGAISRWAANVLRDEDDSRIICPSTDDSWGFPPERVVPVPLFDRYEKIRRMANRLPWFLQKKLIEAVLLRSVRLVGPGDILWVHNRPDYAVIFAPFVHRAGGRIALHLHNSHLVAMPLDQIRNAHIDRFVFVSKFLQNESLQKFPFIASTVLYNGADGNMFYPSRETPPASGVTRVLFASRLVKEKGAHIFLAAMRMLQDSGVPVKGIMVGASHFGGSRITGYMAELHKMAPANVEMRPYCSGSELAQMFRETDIFCAPSIWEEPFGMVNVEAFASEVPVVTTHGGGSKEVFAEGGGLLVERGSTEQLVDALKQLIASPELRRKIAREGRLSFEKNYTWSIVQERYRSIVSSLSS
jgi:glycosyltransferase involved in cell wall biosynthesis